MTNPMITVFDAFRRSLGRPAPTPSPAPQAPALPRAPRLTPLGVDTVTLSPAATATPSRPTFTPPTFGYVTRAAHPVAELAAQLNTDCATLMRLNGWTSMTQTVPAGTAIRVPDTPAARRQAESFGGRVFEPAVASPGLAPGGAKPSEVPYISQYRPDGDAEAYAQATAAWNEKRGHNQAGYAQCGATSLAMVARAAGLGDGLSDAELIVAMGELAGTSRTDGTSLQQVYNGAKAAGLRASTPVYGAVNHLDELNAALARGEMVIANGNYYALHGNSEDNGGHFVVIVGMTAEGQYLIHDPADGNGGEPHVVSPENLLAFFDTHDAIDGGGFVAVAP